MAKLRNKLALPLATFFGLGYVPVIPGTFGAAATLLLYCFYVAYAGRPNDLALAALVVVLSLVSAPAARLASEALNDPDPQIVVVDEAVGQLVAVLFVPAHAANLIAAFVLFRIFDVLKPFPAGRMERLRGGWGIMLDDVVAGIYANICAHLVFFFDAS